MNRFSILLNRDTLKTQLKKLLFVFYGSHKSPTKNSFSVRVLVKVKDYPTFTTLSRLDGIHKL